MTHPDYKRRSSGFCLYHSLFTLNKHRSRSLKLANTICLSLSLSKMEHSRNRFIAMAISALALLLVSISFPTPYFKLTCGNADAFRASVVTVTSAKDESWSATSYINEHNRVVENLSQGHLPYMVNPLYSTIFQFLVSVAITASIFVVKNAQMFSVAAAGTTIIAFSVNAGMMGKNVNGEVVGGIGCIATYGPACYLDLFAGFIPLAAVAFLFGRVGREQKAELPRMAGRDQKAPLPRMVGRDQKAPLPC